MIYAMLRILMSTYNGARYLAEQLDSIIAQTYTDWRLTVRDDGSTDGTLAVLADYAKKDKRITILSDGENLGACKSFERLLTQCNDAEYYAFADQDDVWDINKLAVCMATILSAERDFPDKPIVVHSDLRVVDEQLHEIASSFWQYSNICPDLLNHNIHYLAICNSVTGCAMLFNRAACRSALPFAKKAYMHDAWIALQTMLAGGQIIAIRQTLMAYRQHGNNTLGAVRYSVLGKSWEERKIGAQLSYHMSHPKVYANKMQFWWWKMIYLCHRMIYTRK